MKHFDEETILKFALGIPENEETWVIKNHISECELCSSKLDNIKDELKTIGSFDPKISNKHFLPAIKENELYIWMKIAAVLILGFLGGYFTSDYLQPVQVNVVAQKIIPKVPPSDSTDFIYCPDIDIR